MNSFGVTHGGSCQTTFGYGYHSFQNTSGKPLKIWDLSASQFINNVYKKTVVNNTPITTELKNAKLPAVPVNNDEFYLTDEGSNKNIVVYTKNKVPILVLTRVYPINYTDGIDWKAAVAKAKAEEIPAFYIVTSSSDPSLPPVQVREVSFRKFFPVPI